MFCRAFRADRALDVGIPIIVGIVPFVGNRKFISLIVADFVMKFTFVLCNVRLTLLQTLHFPLLKTVNVKET